jgi:hypothetical protein
VAKITLPVSHSQLAVFHAGMRDPFNDWEDAHVEQGFAWRPGSVSFSTLDEGGDIGIDVVREKKWSIDPAAARVIRVPFEVPEDGIEIASIISGQAVDVPAGRYNLYYETGKKGESLWCRFTFVPSDNPQAEILKADSVLKPPKRLTMKARPATS